MYDFDTVRPRVGLNSSKWDAALKAGSPPDLVPLTVADMEFRSPPVVMEALAKTAEFGMWGYTYDGENFKEAISGWMQKHHGWRAEPGWMIHITGVVHGLYVAVRALTQPGDNVLVQPPVYPPFFNCVTDTGRYVVENPLVLKGERYEIDFEDLERKLENSSLMIFCSPHNPVGRVWSAEEVEKVARLCYQAGVPLLSDEIHCDLVMPGHTHHSVGRLDSEFLTNTVIATSASKTFSLAGLACATLFAPGYDIRDKIKKQLKCDGYEFFNTFGVVSTRTAYNAGADWLEELVCYIQGNYDYLKQALKERLPQIKLYPMEGTYLAWLDFSGFRLSPDELKAFLQQEAALYMNDGRMFGDGGAGFCRMNLACPRSVLEGAVQRLASAAAKRGW